MKTIILAAGKSSRMFPVVDKNCLSFCGKPMIIHIIENCEASGLKDFIIITNKNNKKRIATTMQQFKKNVIIAEQKNLDQGMAGGVLAGLAYVDSDEPVFIHNAQDYFDKSAYTKLLHQNDTIDGAILSQKVTTYFPGGYIQVDTDNTIQSIIEKPGAGHEPSDLVNIVAHYFRKAGDLHHALQNVQSDNDDLYETALQKLFDTKTIKAVPYQATWQALKYPWHILDMMQAMLKKIKTTTHTNVFIDPKATVQGTVIIEDNVKIFNNATIIGPAYIGSGTIIGQNCLIRQSHIGQNCTIGFNTEVARSYLADNVSTHAAYIGDSVVLNDVNMGAFSVTTNLRLDRQPIKMNINEQLIDTQRLKLGAVIGDNAQIGSGATLLPGRIIPPGSCIGPNQIFRGANLTRRIDP
jgi:bifunctional UDP-N-acetylglucosamine pyrophosphorylase/glucosamine-1-phosphate N-acetyltransferase